MTAHEPARLIVNADDLGMSDGINRAIFSAHERGIVTSTSLMAVGAAFDSAVRDARGHERLGVGVHLCLHDEKPVLPPGAVRTLVGADGKMRPLSQVLRRLLTGRLDASEIAAEYAAQVARARDAGIDVTHLDSHCHLHAFPPVARVVRRVAAQFGIVCVRKPEASRLSDYVGAPLGRYPVALMITLCNKLSRAALGDAGVRTTHRFAGMVRSGTVDAAWLAKAVASLEPARWTELVIHPGDGSPLYGAQDDHGPAQRKVEWDAVTSPLVLEAVRARGVKLVNYRDLRECR